MAKERASSLQGQRQVTERQSHQGKWFVFFVLGELPWALLQALLEHFSSTSLSFRGGEQVFALSAEECSWGVKDAQGKSVVRDATSVRIVDDRLQS